MHFDRATLTVRFVDHLGTAADEVWDVSADQADFEFSWLRDEARRLASPPGIEHRPNVLTHRVHEHDWGGDSVTIEAILTISQWVLGQGTGAAFGYAFAELVDRMRSRAGGGNDGQPLARDEAIERARWKIAAAFGVDERQVDVTSEELADGSWTIGLTHAGQASYEVTLAVREGLVMTTRMKRTVDPGAASSG